MRISLQCIRDFHTCKYETINNTWITIWPKSLIDQVDHANWQFHLKRISTVCGNTSHSHPASTIVFKSLSDCHTCAPSLPLGPAKSSSQVGHPCTRAFTNWHVCPLLRDAYLSVPSKGGSKGVEATNFSKGSNCFCLSAILGLSSMQALFPIKLMSAPAFMICKPLRWQPCGLMRAPLRFLGWTTKAVAFPVATKATPQSNSMSLMDFHFCKGPKSEAMILVMWSTAFWGMAMCRQPLTHTDSLDCILNQCTAMQWEHAHVHFHSSGVNSTCKASINAWIVWQRNFASLCHLGKFDIRGMCPANRLSQQTILNYKSWQVCQDHALKLGWFLHMEDKCDMQTNQSMCSQKAVQQMPHASKSTTCNV